MKLTVTRLHHTHAGETYRVGDAFEGSERLLATFADRLAPADQGIKTSDKPKRGRPKKKAPDNADTSDSE